MVARHTVVPVAVLMVAGLMTDAPTASAPAQQASAIRTFLQHDTEPLTSYRGRRFLEARNGRFDKAAWLQVTTQYGPDGFTYQVVDEGGAEIVRRKVLRAALESERKLTRDESGRAFTEANYRFEDGGTEADLARIRVIPRRKDEFLIDGWILVSPRDGDLVAVKGRLAKSPSFWTSRVEIERRYARIAGIRVPVSVQSTASVKLAGSSTFSMRYEYDEINGIAVPSSGASRFD